MFLLWDVGNCGGEVVLATLSFLGTRPTAVVQGCSSAVLRADGGSIRVRRPANPARPERGHAQARIGRDGRCAQIRCEDVRGVYSGFLLKQR
jgi:hypothetical protein